MGRRGQGVQLSLLCSCGKRIALKALGCCRSCYDRRHHSLRFFGGLRERVLERDRFRCRGCGKRSALVVHHRERRNRANLLVTLCIRCHIRIHRSSGLRYWFSEMLVRLWRELHPNDPVLLQLTFGNAGKKEILEKTHVAVLPLLALPDAHTGEGRATWAYGLIVPPSRSCEEGQGPPLPGWTKSGWQRLARSWPTPWFSFQVPRSTVWLIPSCSAPRAE